MDGFQIVKGKKCNKRRKNLMKVTLDMVNTDAAIDNCTSNKKEISHLIMRKRKTLEESPFLEGVHEIMLSAGILMTSDAFSLDRHRGSDQDKHPSPVRDRHPSPVRDRHPSHVRDRHPSPVRDRHPSPVRDRHPSPVQDRHPSPVQDRHPSPVRDRHPSPVRDRHPSPVRDRHPSPVQDRHPSPVQDRHPSPVRDRHPSPVHDRHPSPVRDRHPSPVQDRHPSPVRDRHSSPVRDRNSSPVRDRHSSPEWDRNQSAVWDRHLSAATANTDKDNPLCLNCNKQLTSDIKELVCYGIGRFGSDPIAQYQLGFFLIIRDKLKIAEDRCHVYDPVLSALEKEILSDCGCQVISSNEECKRVTKSRTLFFMPHCGKALYNNLLWANWKSTHIRNVVILGNSFSYMELSTPRRFLEEEGFYILKILPHIREYPVPNTLPQTDIFNDLSLQLAREDILCCVNPNFWSECPEPSYDKGASDVIFNADKKIFR